MNYPEWEVTVDDVETVLVAHGLSASRAEALYEELDHDVISDAALKADDMDDQTNYSYQAIEDQLKELGELDKTEETKFPVD